MIKSENSAHENVEFNHPFLQASFMFLGESLCMVVFLITLGFKVFVESQLFESILSDNLYHNRKICSITIVLENSI